MEKYINKQTIELIESKFFSVFNYIIPGMFVMDLFFKKGIFSQSPQNLYEFLIYIVWCFLFSLPYNIFDNLNINNLFQKIKDKLEEVNISNKKELIEELDKALEENQEMFEQTESMIDFLIIIFYLVITYFLKKFLTPLFININIAKIDTNIILYITTTIIIYIIYFILVRPLIKRFERNNFLIKLNEINKLS